jgi:phage gpG-like protein
MSELSLLGFIAHIGVMHGQIAQISHHALETACQIIHEESRRAVGTYDFSWPQLAPSTQSQRVQLGFTPNDPLLRTGALRDSIQWQVEGNVGFVGSNDQTAVWNFLGTSKIPARDPILGATLAMRTTIEQQIGHSFSSWLGGRGLPVIRQIT